MKELLLVLAIGCPVVPPAKAGREGEHAPDPGQARAGETMNSLMIEHKQQIPAAVGKSVLVKGRYVVTKIAPHRIIEELPDGTVRSSDRSVSVELADGARVLLGPRPEKEMTRLQGRTVIARGVLHLPARSGDPKVAQPDPVPTLVRISEVVLGGEERDG